MADLYRKSSLDKLSNPEQLDRMIKISSPLSWLALIAVLLVIVGLASYAIYKSKKGGKKCIGCPYSGNCDKSCGSK